MNEDLRKAVAEGLAIWKTQGLAHGPELSPELCLIWVNRMLAHSVEPDEFRVASCKVTDISKNWPQPVDVLGIIQEERISNRVSRVKDYVIALGPGNEEVLAPRSIINQGRISELGGDGVAYTEMPLALPETKKDILEGMVSEEARKLLQVFTGDQGLSTVTKQGGER